MLNKLLALKNRENSLKEFCSSVRQGIPLAVFGVNESFKNYLLSVLEDKIIIEDKFSKFDDWLNG